MQKNTRMKNAKIKKINSQAFLDDLKRSTSVMVYAEKTDSYFNTTKKDILSSAETKHIEYFMSENLNCSGYTMVIC